jgi:hypothetical protein
VALTCPRRSISHRCWRDRRRRTCGKPPHVLEHLQRLVAVTVPHPERVKTPEDAQAYLTEARTVASLDHPNIDRR